MTPEQAILESACDELGTRMGLKRPNDMEIMLGAQAHPVAADTFYAIQSPGFRGQQVHAACLSRVYGVAVTIFQRTAATSTPWKLQYKAYDKMGDRLEEIIAALAFNYDLVQRASRLLAQDGQHGVFRGHLDLQGVAQIAPARAEMWGAESKGDKVWAGIYRTATFWGIEG